MIMFLVICSFIPTGQIVKGEIVGWDYCVEQGHSIEFYGRVYGWPAGIVMIGKNYGCTTLGNASTRIIWEGLLTNLGISLLVCVLIEIGDYKTRGM